MRTYIESKNLFLENHLKKPLKKPQIRINALNSIEDLVRSFRPELLEGNSLFTEFNRFSFISQYEKWKGYSLNGAEKSVIRGLFDTLKKIQTVTQYQQTCFRDYKAKIGFPDYTFLYGNPINVLVPVETALNKYMIVGAYPSAKFFTVKGITNVPLYDNDSPFSSETYFDGSRIRTIPSGKELNEVILKRIGIKREDCWITDLVKVFLFKEGHVKRYMALGKNHISENRSRFSKYAQASIPCLLEEIEIANPKLIILLGAEVTSVLFSITFENAKSILDGKIHDLNLCGKNLKTICLPHPGILMKQSDKNPWPEKFIKEISINAQKAISIVSV